MISRPTWKNAAAFTFYPLVAVVMAVCCLLLIVLAWPVCLLADFDKAEQSAKETP